MMGNENTDASDLSVFSTRDADQDEDGKDIKQDADQDSQDADQYMQDDVRDAYEYFVQS
jgi:hypothetical protein